MSLPAKFSILMNWKSSWRNGKLMLLWYITKLIYQENWPLQPFYFAVILKVFSCRFTCQKLVRIDRIEFFYSDFKEKHFSSYRQGHKEGDIPLQRGTKSQISCVLLTFFDKNVSFLKSTLNSASFEYKTLLFAPIFTT